MHVCEECLLVVVLCSSMPADSCLIKGSDRRQKRKDCRLSK